MKPAPDAAAPRQPGPTATVPELSIREHRPSDPRWRGDLLAPSSHSRLVPDPAEAVAVVDNAGGGRSDQAPGAERAGGSSGLPAASDEAGGRSDLPTGAAAAREAAGGRPASLRSESSAFAAAAEPVEAWAAEVTRELLGDFAPALLLLPATERSRVRALLAYARMVLDCAGAHGPEGERLARIDRWQSDLERALGGASGPPICRRMARENARRRWPSDALDDLAACARRRVLVPRPATAAAAEAEARSLARAVGGALLEARLNAEVNGFASALIRLHALQHLGAALARGRCPLPEGEGLAGEALAAAVERECARLRPPLLRAPRGLVELPTAYRRAGVFSLLAALRLLSEIEESGAAVIAAPPRLAPATRIGLLLRARWFGPRVGPA